jgi:hypothetical protein
MACCPACQYVAKVISKIEPEKGELRELKPKPKPVKNEWKPEEKAHFYGELKGYAARHGYKEGWASNKYRERFNVWPNGYKDAPLQVPKPETLSWIKSRAIAWAKSKTREQQHDHHR